MKRLTIVGAGITGLLAALKLYKDYQLNMLDLGSDPRFSKHLLGATYSGFNARHVSFTETAPWTTQHRLKLITRASSEGGWLCIPKEELNDFEKEWIAQFQRVANDNQLHKSNTLKVIELNKKGAAEWEKLGKEYGFLKPNDDESTMPIICRSKNDLLGEFGFESSLDERCKLYEGTPLPVELSPLTPNQSALGNLGYLTLYGRTYYVQTICTNLINYLESQGVSFNWNQGFSKGDEDLIVWCSGVSKQASSLLKEFKILLEGVIGCWVSMDNPGITRACKIYGPEPVNYINITPFGSTLFMSGGYGFVGARPYGEAVKLGEPIMEAMISEIEKWFPRSKIKEKAFCIRPSTPTGVPTMLKGNLNGTPIVIAVGHCAGGFTQAPYTAEMIKTSTFNQP